MNPPTSSLLRQRLAPVLLPVVVALTAVLAGCSRPAPAPEPVRAVRTVTVSADSAGGSHDYAAEVRARTESRLGFRVGGKMVARPAEVGQRVRAGQVLAQLDPQDLRLAQTAAGAALQAAQVNLELAEADFQRFQGLRAQGFISAAELDRRDSTLKAAKAQFAQAQAQAGVQGNQAAYSVLTAPAAGVVTAVEAEPGAVLAAGAPVVRLAHDGPRDVVFAVPEDVVARMRPLLGQPGALKVRLWGTQTLLPATLREVAAAADPATRTFLVKADLGRAEAQLGQTASVVIDLPRQEGVTRLPLTAVLQQQGKTVVWLLDTSSMTVQTQPVQVAGADGNTVIVSSGLRPGQVVVTAGVHVLTPGQKVKLYQPALPPGTAPASAAAR